MGLSFVNDTDCTLRAYSDSDWAGCPSTRRSTGGFCTSFGQNLISWSSKKQPTVSKSSTEAEYSSLSETASKLAWISHLLKELGISLPVTPELFGDNLPSIYLTANPAFHKRTKHFETDYHYVRERVALGSLVVRHIPARLQLADIFMKSLPTAPFQSLRFKLGVDNPPTLSLRGAIDTSTKSRNGWAQGKKQYEPKPVQAHSSRPKEVQSQSSQQLSPTAPTLKDKNRAQEEKRRGKEIATACTKQRGGPVLYNSFETLGSIGE